MKKTLIATLLAFMAGSIGHAQTAVYQIPNSDFSLWASDKEPGNGWNSFKSAGGSLAGMGSSSAPNPSKDTGRSGADGDYSCKIFSNSILGVKANGNLTTGRINMGNMAPASSQNYNYTDRATTGANLLFAGRPDAVEFYAKFTSGGSPNGRGQFILHGDVDYRDPEVADQASYKVGIASVVITATDTWQRFSSEFTYTQEDTPAKQYMLASFTTNPTPGGSKGDYLWIDDVRLIYYHALSSLSYEGATIDFSENTLEYDLSDFTYEAEKLSFTQKGVGATVETDYNEETAILTITVKGNDYTVNAESVTTYQVRFATTPTPEVAPAEGLGERVDNISYLDMSKTYVLYNAHFKAFAIYDADYSTDKIWTAEMIGDADHQLNTSDYSGKLDLTDAGSSWMVIGEGPKCYLYNMGAGKYANIPAFNTYSAPCTFSEDPISLFILPLEDAQWAFSVVGGMKDYMCAAPQLTTGPISVWTANDAGSAWQLYENPNIAADLDLLEEVTGIGSVNLAPETSPVYTLTGVKLGNIPTAQLPAGVYVIGGRKVLVK